MSADEIIYAQYWYRYLKVRYWYLDHWYWYLFVEYVIQDSLQHCPDTYNIDSDIDDDKHC